jgi:hypothetical protein
MGAGTVTLVLYLAGLGRAPAILFLDPWLWRFPQVHNPFPVPMRSIEACRYVAERERARGTRARCEVPGETPVDFATELQMVTFDGPKNKPWIIGGWPVGVAECQTRGSAISSLETRHLSAVDGVGLGVSGWRSLTCPF